jgi:hypothetical protein
LPRKPPKKRPKKKRKKKKRNPKRKARKLPKNDVRKRRRKFSRSKIDAEDALRSLQVGAVGRVIMTRLRLAREEVIGRE